MKIPLFLALALVAVLVFPLGSCKKAETRPQPATETVPSTQKDPNSEPDAPSEVPLLPIKAGDFWRYQVDLEVMNPSTAADGAAAAPETRSFSVTRTYLGKLPVKPDKPPVDVFEVVTPGEETERELVEIHADQIHLRGSVPFKDGVAGKPIWLDTPVPFVAANIRAGSSLPSISMAEGEVTRGIQVVGREEVVVPAGTFRAIKLLMSGMDSKAAGIEMRRTTWFAPGVGIVKEITSRYTKDLKIMTRTQILTETSVPLP
ncbi:MAG: hypothetical protein MUF04_01640 [Akkermansiaceae bacterium]|jgi:hypothetical protein|nr:hypothetical protein [Akkermansiaceae bacterium]